MLLSVAGRPTPWRTAGSFGVRQVAVGRGSADCHNRPICAGPAALKRIDARISNVRAPAGVLGIVDTRRCRRGGGMHVGNQNDVRRCGPGVARGQALPFRYADGGGAYVTSRRPVTVVLAPGASGYIGVAKYRCDLGITRTAAAIRLALPADRGQVFTARDPVGVSGPPGLSYCRGGPHDPGQLVTVSPIERTRPATSSLR